MLSTTLTRIRSNSKNIKRNVLNLQELRVAFSSFSTYIPDSAFGVQDGVGSSDEDLTVAIFGASGFLGRHICSNLGYDNKKTYVGNRGDEFEMRYLKPCYDLGRLKFQFYSPRDIDSMRAVISDADVVINLIGKNIDSRVLADRAKFPYLYMKTNFSLYDANVSIPRTIAELCTEMQVDNLIHFSSMSASPNSMSYFARSKYEGECAVKEAYPWATIIKPAHVFGPQDRFLNHFATFASRSSILLKRPVIPCNGSSMTQPVYCGDIAKVVSRIVKDPEAYEGKSIHCFGPTEYTTKEIISFVCDIIGEQPRFLDLQELPKSLKSFVQNQLKKKEIQLKFPKSLELWLEDCVPTMTQDEYDRKTDVLTFKDFNIKPTLIEKVAFNYLHRFREGGHFIDTTGYHGYEYVPSPKIK